MQCFTVFELCVAIGKSEELLILDTLWLSLSLEAHRICILPFWKLLSFILGVDDFFTSGLLFQYSFFFLEEYFCTLLRHSDFFLISVIFLIFMNSIPMPLKKKLHPFAVFIFCYLSGDITERCLFFFFFLVSPRQCLFPPYSFFYCLFYII